MPKQVITFAPAGSFASLKIKGVPARTAKHERGRIQNFSIRSRSRLMQKIAQLKRHNLPLFVTLTYPEDYPNDYKTYKYHLHHFFIALRRRWERAGIVWKLEYQQRGAPHFHLLMWGVEHNFRDDVARLWCKIVDSDDENHLKWHLGQLGNGNTHCVQEIRSWHGVRSYAAKYMAKLDERDDQCGRFWGVRGLVPFSPLLSFSVSMETALTFRRLHRRYTGMNNRRFGFWSYAYHVDWLRLIEALEAPPLPPEPPKYFITPPPVPDYECYFF